MKYLFLLLFAFGCVKNSEEKVAKKEQTRTPIEERRRPSYNQQFLTKQVTSSEEEELRLERLRLLKEEEEYYVRRKMAEEQALNQNQNSTVSKNDYPVIKEQSSRERISREPISREPYPALKEPNNEPMNSKSQILEISGSQGRTNYSNPTSQNSFNEMEKSSEILIPPSQADFSVFSSQKRGNFIISTSPTYSGILLEEARQILEQFGTVKAVREGERFALKLEPRGGIQTEEEARELMKKIISTSFFDVYIEKSF